MNDETEFEQRLHAHLDAHRDPLDDPEVVAFLAVLPEHLPGFARARETLRLLPAVAPAPRRRWPRLLAAATAAALAGGVLTLALTHAPVPPAPTSRILDAELVALRPRAHAAVQFAMCQPLVASATTTLETYERRSLRR